MTLIQPINRNSINCILEYLLIGISSALLGIWAVKDTIALRNIFLGIGFLLGLIYILFSYKKDFFRGAQFKDFLPIALIMLMFLWVLAHLFIFSQYPAIQLQELKSTWLRAFLAVVIGVSTGLALQHHTKLMNLLWLGIGVSFLYLIFQYVPRAYAGKSLFAVDWYGGYYIYIGKINGVLMGSVLFCGLGANWIDLLRSKALAINFINTILPLTGMAIVLYAYVFVFDTRNGLGISALLIFAWISYAAFWLLLRGNIKSLTSRFKGVLLLTVFVVSLFSWFALQQTRHNSGWLTIFEDAKIAAQIEKYPNWQDPGKLGYPKTDTGREVAGNTYERVAWAVAGIRLIPENIVGIGVLSKPFMRLLQKNYPDITPSSTHSAWIEFTLAFGLPAFFLMFGALFSILYLSITAPNSYFNISVISLALTLMLLYLVGELSTQHGVEVLFYLIALMTGLRAHLFFNLKHF